MDKMENDYVTIWVENGILFSSSKKDILIDLDVAKTMVKDRVEYTKGKSYPMLIYFSNLSVTKEAREYMSSPEGGLKGILCGAFLSDSVVTTVVVNFYLKINKPAVPAKFFTKKEEALSWLESFKRAS